MAAEKSIGTTLKIVAPSSPATIADLVSIGEIGVESSDIETTTLDSPNGYREFIGSLKDAGELSLSGMVKSEANMEDMLGFAESQEILNWEIEAPSGSKWAFDGYVKMFKEGEVTIEGVRTFNASIRISGAPVYTAPVISA